MAEGQAMMAAGRPRDAIAAFGRALAIRPDDPEILVRLSGALLELGQARPALNAANRAIAVAPENEWGHQVRAHALARLKKRRLALASAQEAASLAPQDPSTLLTLAWAQLACRENDDAHITSQKVLSLAPEDADSHCLLAEIARRDGDGPQAEAHLRKALALEPSPSTLNRLASVVRRAGRRREAVELLHAAAQLSPANEAIRSQLYFGIQGLLVRRLIVTVVCIVIVWKVFIDDGKSPSAGDDVRLLAVGGVFGLLVLSYWLFRSNALSKLHPSVAAFYRSERARRNPPTPIYHASLLFVVSALPMVAPLAWEKKNVTPDVKLIALICAPFALGSASYLTLRFVRWLDPVFRKRRRHKPTKEAGDR